ncbi:MAG: hypothetical protein HYV38_01380, partial [Candidatus Levybacteria bacterium]|nr:hypothetical protein [Candidatus Levybacteria bacterium]
RLLEAEREYPPDLSEEDIIPIIRREITFADLRKKYTKPDTSASPEVVPPISGISNSGTIVDSSEIARISSQVAVQTPTQMPRSPRSSEDNASFLDHILTSSPPRVPFTPPPTPRPIVRTLPRPATVRIDTSASVRRTEPKKPNTQRIPSPKIGGNKDNNVNRVEQDGSFSSYFFTLEETLVMADVLIRLNVQSPIDAKRVGVEIDMEQLKNLRLNVALLWKRFPRKLSDFLQARGPLWRKLGEIASQPERERIKGKPSDTETYLLMRLSGLSRTQIELLKKAVLDWGSRK